MERETALTSREREKKKQSEEIRFKRLGLENEYQIDLQIHDTVFNGYMILRFP